MRKILFIVSIMLIANLTMAQKNADIGIWAGTGTYFGDLTQINVGKSLAFNYGAFARYNFNTRVSARMQVINGNIKTDGSIDTHPWTFSKNVTNLSLMVEINFFKYALGKKEMPITTYLLAGIGMGRYTYSYNFLNLRPIVTYLNDPAVNTQANNPTLKSKTETLASDASESILAPQIPIGFGFKFNVNKKIGLGLEVILNKYFDDKIDNLDDPRMYYKTPVSNPPEWVKYTDRWHNNDYTVYAGIHLTYRINLSKKACPVYEYE